MAVATADILEAVSSLTVLELSQLIKDMEEKFGGSRLQPRSPWLHPLLEAERLLQKKRPSSPSFSIRLATTRST